MKKAIITAVILGTLTFVIHQSEATAQYNSRFIRNCYRVARIGCVKQFLFSSKNRRRCRDEAFRSCRNICFIRKKMKMKKCDAKWKCHLGRGCPVGCGHQVGCREAGSRDAHSSQALMRICTNSKVAPGYKVIVLEPKLNHGSVRIFHTRAYKAAQRGAWSANSPAMRKLSGHIAKFAYKKKKRVTVHKLIRVRKNQILACFKIE